MFIKEKIKSNLVLKKWVHWLLVPSNQARPRAWVKLMVNPFYHHRGKSSIIRWSARLDVLPFNQFSLGDDSIIEDFCTVNNGVGNVIIGNNSLIGMGNVLIGPIQIGNNVIFAQNIVASALNHEYRAIDIPIKSQKILTKPIIIEDDCWIAANSVITSGVTVGKHSVIAAGSIVTKNVPPYSVVAGNPAKIIKKFDFSKSEWVKVES
jgi:acetyltransferase-like isoleucine patch superfamily enzyme